jgi:hypothetical protein
MKKPQLKALENVKTEDPFVEKVQEIKQQSTENQAIKKNTAKIKPKSYSLPEKHINYINQKASEMSKERGKPIGASEALRIVIEEHSSRLNA